jgi:protein SCO1
MKKTIVYLLVITVSIIALATSILYEQKHERKLPILNPTDVYPALVDSSLHNKGINHTILDFHLINQNGDSVTQEIIKDRVVVANFFFATCPTICPIMNNQLSRVHDKYVNNDDVIILSHTVWPEIDTFEALKEYGKLFFADPKRWQFLTGDKHHLYNLARKSYLVAPSVNDTNFDQGGEGDFIHTENIVLIDKKRRIRGFYDGTDSLEVSQLIEDVQILLEHK